MRTHATAHRIIIFVMAAIIIRPCRVVPDSGLLHRAHSWLSAYSPTANYTRSQRVRCCIRRGPRCSGQWFGRLRTAAGKRGAISNNGSISCLAYRWRTTNGGRTDDPLSRARRSQAAARVEGARAGRIQSFCRAGYTYGPRGRRDSTEVPRADGDRHLLHDAVPEMAIAISSRYFRG